MTKIGVSMIMVRHSHVDLDQKLFEHGPDYLQGPTIKAMMEPNARCPTEQNSCLTFLQLARKVSAILPGQVVASGSYKLWFGCMRNGPRVIVFAPNGTAGSISRMDQYREYAAECFRLASSEDSARNRAGPGKNWRKKTEAAS
jgi:hypothetical protein